MLGLWLRKTPSLHMFSTVVMVVPLSLYSGVDGIVQSTLISIYAKHAMKCLMLTDFLRLIPETILCQQFQLKSKHIVEREMKCSSLLAPRRQSHHLQKSTDCSHFITGSLDKSAQLWDNRTLTLIKTYVTERPVNADAMSPLLNHVVLGGGQDASALTTTDHRAGKFEAKFYDKVVQEEIGGVKGHFGPINALAFNPDGKSFLSGGEDGYVRLHHFDPDYFKIPSI